MSNQPIYVSFEMSEHERRELWRHAMREAGKAVHDSSIAGFVSAMIASVLDVEDGKVLPDARLREELGANEDDVWTLLLALEDELDADLGEVTDAFVTVGDVIDYCEKAAQAQRA